jgi:DNA-directed RNA polymerase specialized sigma24 family protein
MSVQMEKPYQEMSLPELMDHCRREMEHYTQRRPYDDQYCLEIFRRAMLQNDALAWDAVYCHFKPTLMNWFRRHPNRQSARHFDTEENYVARTIERFWLAAVHNGELKFGTTAAALRYLHACLNGAILDTLRFHSRSQEQPLPEPNLPNEPVAEEPDNGHEVWTVLRSMLPDERERRLAYLLFHCGLKPREIIQHCPQEFSSVQEIYRLHRNIIDRLQRKREQIRWLLSEE